MVEQEPLAAEPFERQRHQEDQVGRVAGVDRIETAPERDLQRQPHLVEQRRCIFDEVTLGAVRLQWQRVTMDIDAVQPLEPRLVPLADRADDRDLIASRYQRVGFLPHPPVERQRQVFDDDEDAAGLFRRWRAHQLMPS